VIPWPTEVVVVAEGERLIGGDGDRGRGEAPGALVELGVAWNGGAKW
jgi:hypothetical protein